MKHEVKSWDSCRSKNVDGHSFLFAIVFPSNLNNIDLKNFPNNDGTTDLRDFRESFTNIQDRDRDLRSLQRDKKIGLGC